MLRTTIIAASLAFVAMPATAQEAADPYAACAVISNDADRLSCFDRTHATQRVVVERREAAEEVQRAENFGFREAEQAAKAAQDEAALTVTVTEVLEGARRSQVLLMDNGQLWREIGGSTLRNRVREGWTGAVTQHWSGAYEIRFEGRSGYLRVARVR